MNKVPVIIIDADAIIAQANPEDFHHKQAIEISKSLANLNAKILYPSTTILESVTHIQRVLSDNINAHKIINTAIKSKINIIEVNKHILSKALNYFNPNTSKKNTLFDCTIAAIAEEYNADAIFSFDKFYKKLGFKLASEL